MTDASLGFFGRFIRGKQGGLKKVQQRREQLRHRELHAQVVT